MTEGRLTFVTLATNDAYAIGALILGHSLRQTGTKNELTIIITEGVPHNFRELLRGVFDNVVVVKPLQNLNTRNLSLLRRPELGITYSKLYCWKLIEFTKGVFLDADTIVLQNIDDLFDREELSAAPDASWPDIFNSGVFVFRPSLKTFAELCELAKTKGSFDGGDQGLLNEYFSGWGSETLDRHLPFIYNCSCWIPLPDRPVFYTRPPAWKKFGNQVKVAHFAGLEKPWKYRMAANDGAICHAIERLESSDSSFTVAEAEGVLAFWWATFFKRVKHELSYGMFLSTVFEPVPPPPPPPPPTAVHANYAAESQDQSSFWLGETSYHPEFHDTSFDYLHSGQRVDEASRFKEFHMYNEPPKQTEPPQHTQHHCHYRKYEPEVGPTYHHVQQSHHGDPQTYSNEEHCQPSQDRFPQREQCQEPNYREHQYHHQQHQQNVPCLEELKQEDPPQKQPPPPPAEKNGPPEFHNEDPLLQPSLPPAPSLEDEPRNDKDPLFFVPKPMCPECLRELRWSRQFVDPLHRGFLAPLSLMPLTSSSSRVRRRSVPLWPSGLQIVRDFRQSTSLCVATEKPLKGNGNHAQKKDDCLHVVQKRKSNHKRGQKKQLDRNKLLDAAKKRMHLKGEEQATIKILPRTVPGIREVKIPTKSPIGSTSKHGTAHIPANVMKPISDVKPRSRKEAKQRRTKKAADPDPSKVAPKKVEAEPAEIGGPANEAPWLPRCTRTRSVPQH
uniref:glycogenin glucosyltransferase n=1 Tax=Mesocestoides corti TaxID=53468 RepID=A0A5K3FWD1_MESCO